MIHTKKSPLLNKNSPKEVFYFNITKVKMVGEIGQEKLQGTRYLTQCVQKVCKVIIILFSTKDRIVGCSKQDAMNNSLRFFYFLYIFLQFANKCFGKGNYSRVIHHFKGIDKRTRLAQNIGTSSILFKIGIYLLNQLYTFDRLLF